MNILTSLSSYSSSSIQSTHLSSMQNIASEPSRLTNVQENYDKTCKQLKTSEEELQALQRYRHDVTVELNNLVETITNQESHLKSLEKTHEVACKNIEEQTKTLRENYIISLGSDISNAIEKLQNFKNNLQILDEKKKKLLEDITYQRTKKILEPLTLHATTLKTEISRIDSQIPEIIQKINSLLTVKELYRSSIDSETSIYSSSIVRRETDENKQPITVLTTLKAPTQSQISSSSSTSNGISVEKSIPSVNLRKENSFSESPVEFSSEEDSWEKEIIEEEGVIPLTDEEGAAVLTTLSSQHSTSLSSSSSTVVSVEDTLQTTNLIEKLRPLIKSDMPDDLKMIIVYNHSPTNWTEAAVSLLKENESLQKYPDLPSKRAFLNQKIGSLKRRKPPLYFGPKYPSITIRSKEIDGKRVHEFSEEEMKESYTLVNIFKEALAVNSKHWSPHFLQKLPKGYDFKKSENQIRVLRAHAKKKGGILFKGTKYEICLDPSIYNKERQPCSLSDSDLAKIEELKNLIKEDMPIDLKIMLIFKHMNGQNWVKAVQILFPDIKTRSITNRLARLKKNPKQTFNYQGYENKSVSEILGSQITTSTSSSSSSLRSTTLLSSVRDSTTLEI